MVLSVDPEARVVLSDERASVFILFLCALNEVINSQEGTAHSLICLSIPVDRRFLLSGVNNTLKT